MQVEAASVSETVEQLYARVFRALKPRTNLPRITIRFRKYANANSRISLQDDHLRIDLSDLFEAAPPAVQEALAVILICKLSRKLPDPSLLTRYRRYLDRPEMRRHLHRVTRERGRKAFRHASGKAYDLRDVFEELNFKYFHGLMARPELGWSLKPSRTCLGHYDASHHVIVLTSLLDSISAPQIVVEFIMFHEMLHLRFPTEHRGARQCIHTKAFKEAEKSFEQYEEAKLALKQFLEESGELGELLTAEQIQLGGHLFEVQYDSAGGEKPKS
jgi:hypothetical protein